MGKKPKEKRVKKRKMVRERRKRKETTKFSCLLSPNLVISYYIYQIRHLIIISALQKRGKKRPTASVRKVPQSKRAKCQTNSLLSTKRPTSVDKTKKNYPKRWCFLSNKTKKNPFFPHLKQKTDKNKNFPYKSNEKNSLHYSVFVSLS